MPILIVVIYASLPLAWAYSLPNDFLNYARQINASLAFISNFISGLWIHIGPMMAFHSDHFYTLGVVSKNSLHFGALFTDCFIESFEK